VTDGRIFEIFQPLITNDLQAGGVDYTWIQLGVECSETPNAYALPGGYIVVTSGLLKKMKTDAGLRFVLGHELGHFFGRDHLRGLGKGLAFLSVISVLGWGGLELSAVNAGFEAGQLAHQRDQERAADAYALRLISEKGFSLQGSEEFFELIVNDSDWQSKIPLLLRTHPGSEERLRSLYAVIGESPKKEAADRLLDRKISLEQQPGDNSQGLAVWGTKLCAN